MDVVFAIVPAKAQVLNLSSALDIDLYTDVYSLTLVNLYEYSQNGLK